SWRPSTALAAVVLAASIGPFTLQPPAEAALAGTAPASMCEATNPSVTDPTAVGDARRVADVLVVGDTVYLAGKFTHLVSSGTTTPVPRNHIGACSLSTGQVLPWTADADDFRSEERRVGKERKWGWAPGPGK